MNKKVLLFVIGLCLITSVLAIWIVSIYSSSNHIISSSEYGGLSVIKDFGGGDYESLNTSITTDDEFIFENTGFDVSMEILIDTLVSDVDNDTCTNYENDCEYNYKLFSHHYPNGSYESESNLIEGTNVEYIYFGNNKVVFELDCVQYTCPQTISPSVLVTKIPN